jgi:hypothetical protein
MVKLCPTGSDQISTFEDRLFYLHTMCTEEQSRLNGESPAPALRPIPVNSNASTPAAPARSVKSPASSAVKKKVLSASNTVAKSPSPGSAAKGARKRADSTSSSSSDSVASWYENQQSAEENSASGTESKASDSSHSSAESSGSSTVVRSGRKPAAIKKAEAQAQAQTSTSQSPARQKSPTPAQGKFAGPVLNPPRAKAAASATKSPAAKPTVATKAANNDSSSEDSDISSSSDESVPITNNKSAKAAATPSKAAAPTNKASKKDRSSEDSDSSSSSSVSASVANKKASNTTASPSKLAAGSASIPATPTAAGNINTKKRNKAKPPVASSTAESDSEWPDMLAPATVSAIKTAFATQPLPGSAVKPSKVQTPVKAVKELTSSDSDSEQSSSASEHSRPKRRTDSSGSSSSPAGSDAEADLDEIFAPTPSKTTNKIASTVANGTVKSEKTHVQSAAGASGAARGTGKVEAAPRIKGESAVESDLSSDEGPDVQELSSDDDSEEDRKPVVATKSAKEPAAEAKLKEKSAKTGVHKGDVKGAKVMANNGTPKKGSDAPLSIEQMYGDDSSHSSSSHSSPPVSKRVHTMQTPPVAASSQSKASPALFALPSQNLARADPALTTKTSQEEDDREELPRGDASAGKKKKSKRKKNRKRTRSFDSDSSDSQAPVQAKQAQANGGAEAAGAASDKKKKRRGKRHKSVGGDLAVEDGTADRSTAAAKPKLFSPSGGDQRRDAEYEGKKRKHSNAADSEHARERSELAADMLSKEERKRKKKEEKKQQKRLRQSL